MLVGVLLGVKDSGVQGLWGEAQDSGCGVLGFRVGDLLGVLLGVAVHLRRRREQHSRPHPLPLGRSV